MVPTFDKFLFPVLNILRDGKEHSLKSLMEDIIIAVAVPSKS